LLKEKEIQKKRNIKSRKIDKRKRKMLVLTCIIISKVYIFSIMLLLCCIILSMSYDCVTVTVTCDVIITSHFLSKSKIKKSKIKPSLLFTLLIVCS